MTKREFDELSEKMFPSVSGCADYMWGEVEREVVAERKRAAAAEAEVRELLEQKHRLQAEVMVRTTVTVDARLEPWT